MEGRDDMLSTAVVDDGYMFSARHSRKFGLRVCLAVQDGAAKAISERRNVDNVEIY